MSILIKGMEMPKNCLLCPFGNEFGKCCVNAELEDANELTHSCPLIKLPDHGSLIDRRYLLKDYQKCCDGIECRNCPFIMMVGSVITDCKIEKFIREAPVVIPAERGEESK